MPSMPKVAIFLPPFLFLRIQFAEKINVWSPVLFLDLMVVQICLSYPPMNNLPRAGNFNVLTYVSGIPSAPSRYITTLTVACA